jgi:hypothetical protein
MFEVGAIHESPVREPPLHKPPSDIGHPFPSIAIKNQKNIEYEYKEKRRKGKNHENKKN